MKNIEKYDLEIKQFDLKKKRLELKEANLELQRTNKRIILEQLSELRSLVSERAIDNVTNVFASETKYKQLLDDDEMELVKIKIFELIRRL